MASTDFVERQITLGDINPLDFYGVNNEKFDLIKAAYPGVKFIARGNQLKTLGEPDKLQALQQLLGMILEEIRNQGGMDTQRLSELLRAKESGEPEARPPARNDIIVRGPGGVAVRAKTPGQQQIVDLSAGNDLVFAVGPAGTGKTYTAVAIAVQALKARQVKKIILVRPAVEAGEQLGFLPGDLKEKVDPYLQPLYDGLQDMIPAEKLADYMETSVVEIVPLAYMRGRTLNNAFIILDEAQNATRNQLKMFLTRMGLDSKIIVTGDATQVDLPNIRDSGLMHAVRLLDNIPGVGVVYLDGRDVVRHKLVRQVLEAYEREEEDRPPSGGESPTPQPLPPSAGDTASPGPEDEPADETGDEAT